MAGNMISQISNAFSSGGGGVNFEQRIQAMFLLSLLIDGFCPAMNEPTKRVCFQTKHLGVDVDDVAVFTYRNGTEGKLLIQIKHSITATENDKTFQGVICAAWSDFIREGFDKENDKIALATAQISTTAQQSLRFLHAAAVGAVDEKEFIDKLNLPVFSSADNRNMFRTLENCIEKINGSKPTNFEIWMFCRAFTLLLFDMDCEESVNRALSSSLIKCNCTIDAKLVWTKLVEYAGYCNQSAASIDRENIDQEILTMFSRKEIIQVPPSPIKEIDLFIPTVALIGAWKDDNTFDQKIIEMISGGSYSEFEAKARSMVSQQSEYLRLSNGNWQVLHKEALLEQCTEKLFDDVLEKLFAAAKEVLSQKSKRLNKEIPYLLSSESEYENSLELRKSIVKSICWIKKALPDLKNCNQNKVDSSIFALMKSLFEGADWTTWASLGDSLQSLAELAPDVFLEQLECEIIQKPEEILRLFPQRDSSLFGSKNYIAELLWALEILAWSPDYLVRSICTLGLLEELSYERTNWANTPINSIVSILLPWYPQTVADAQKKKNALQCLKTDTPEVFWKVLKKLLPNHTSSTTGNPKPKYLAIEIPDEIKVTVKDVHDEYAFLLELAMDTASDNPQKLSELVDQIGYMNESTLVRLLECIEGCVANDNEQKFNIWLNLRERIAVLKPTKEMVVYKQLERIQLLIQKLEPRDIRWKYRDLYLGNRFLVDKGDYSNRWERLEADKLTAAKEIYNQYGIVETEIFGVAVNNTRDVASKLGQSLNQDQISQAIDLFYSGKLSQEFTISCINSFVFKCGAKCLLNTTLSQKDDNFILKILTSIPFTLDILAVVKQILDNDALYWERAAMPYCCSGNRIDELNIIVEKLISCKRYVTAINLVGRSEFESVVDPEKIYSLLKLAGTEESIGNEQLDHYATQQIIKWLQNQESIDLDARSDIEFIYLPVLDEYSEVQPHSLNTRLSLNPDYFCSMIELFYKKRADDAHEVELNKGISDRLFEILFKFKITPGVDWNGNFDENSFKKWMDYVKTWSKENDRFAVTMQTVGSGLSYAHLNDEKFPEQAIVDELNRVENSELRRGYYLGIVNQRGVHYVDPEGKPELEMAVDYGDRASAAEARGYLRYATVLHDIAEQYKREAEHNISIAQKENEE